MKPLLSVEFSDLFKWNTWKVYQEAMQPLACMWLIGGEQPSKSGAVQAYSLCPNSWVVLRLMEHEPRFNPDRDLHDPEKLANDWVACIREISPFIIDPSRTLVTGPFNEIQSWNLFDEFTQMEALRCQKTWDEFGIRSVLGNFSVGTPDEAHIEAFAPALRVARRCGGVLGLHQGPQIFADDEARWTTERNQLWDEILFDKFPDTEIPTMVTELGIGDIWTRPDQIEIFMRLTGGHHTDGWANCGDALLFRGSSKSVENNFIDVMKDCTLNYMNKYRRVKSAFIFMSTREGFWKSWDPEPVMPQLAAWIGSEIPDGLVSLDPQASLEELAADKPWPAVITQPVPAPTNMVALKTASTGGQNIRAHHSLNAPIVGTIEYGEIAYMRQEEVADLGKERGWVYIKTSKFEGWAAAWLLSLATQ
jgi:hypothetical protein